MYADKNPWWLLLLCVGPSGVAAEPRQELCENGSGHVWGHQVSKKILTSRFTVRP